MTPRNPYTQGVMSGVAGTLLLTRWLLGHTQRRHRHQIETLTRALHDETLLTRNLIRAQTRRATPSA